MRNREIAADVAYSDGLPVLIVHDRGAQTRFSYKGKDALDEVSFLRMADAINAVPIVKIDGAARQWEFNFESFIAGFVLAAVGLPLIVGFFR